MTLDEYEKLLSEKRKALEVLKSEERKVALDKDFEAMQLIDKKKEDADHLFIKLVGLLFIFLHKRISCCLFKFPLCCFVT